MKKSSVLSNKVTKHSSIPKLESIIDGERKITHEAFAQNLDSILKDPAQIKLKVPKADVSSFYFPIVQNGGNYLFARGPVQDLLSAGASSLVRGVVGNARGLSQAF